MSAPIKYIAEITHVREVWLLGTADLDFWKRHLKSEDLYPTECGGMARLLISAIDAKYMGVRFRELGISVFVSRHADGVQHDGFYLAHGFHTSRLFALIERRFFGTPYVHASIHVDVVLPASMRMMKHGEVVLGGEMAADAHSSSRAPTRRGEECFDGPIFLPGTERRSKRPDKLFFARLSGHAQTHPFLESKDRITLKPSDDLPIIRWLVDSSFTGQAWVIRDNATHARSKTFARSILSAT